MRPIWRRPRNAILIRTIAVAAAALAGAACGHEESAEKKGAAPVRTARSAPATLVSRIRLSGRIVPPADRDAQLVPIVAGRLSEVLVRPGEHVRKGQVLAKIESGPFEDLLNAALAADHRADSEMGFRRSAADRTRMLFEKGVASKEEAEADEAAAVAAASAREETAAALSQARRNLDGARLTAPFEGTVVRVLRARGEHVDGTSAAPVLEVAGAGSVEVAADATAGALGSIRIEGAARVHVEGSAAPDLEARVLRAARAVDPSTGVGEVRIGFKTQSEGLVIGASVAVTIVSETRQAPVAVPVQALRRRPDGGMEVVAVESGKTKVHTVETGIVDGETAEIVSGLDAGAEVIVDDPTGLADGIDIEKQP
jgi:RND family efflux transporter MFP subunit